MNIFVFGSNLAGRHGAGAARYALDNYGAVYGRGVGHVGNSYALPTKDKCIRTLPIGEVARYVERFCRYAETRPDLTFKVTQIGCGLAGFEPEQIAPLFADAPSNCEFDSAWEPWLPSRRFWGNIE